MVDAPFRYSFDNKHIQISKLHRLSQIDLLTSLRSLHHPADISENAAISQVNSKEIFVLFWSTPVYPFPVPSEAT